MSQNALKEPPAHEEGILELYNYDEFIPEKYELYMRWDQSPPLGEPAPDANLWRLDDRSEARLSAFWKKHPFTVIEFGSFT